MENFTIQTSQNVHIDQPIASVGDRLAAALLDLTFFLPYLFVITFIGTIANTPQLIAILSIPLVFYHLLCELLMKGQSWGKKIMKIRVTTIDGRNPGFFAYLLRWVFRLIDVTLLMGSVSVVSIIASKNSQRLGDMAANTIVIKTKPQNSRSTLFTKLPDNYSLNYKEVGHLDDEDIYIVKEVLQFLESSHKSSEAMLLADKTKKALEVKMKITAGIRAEHFLYKVLRDYNYINSGKYSA